MLRISSIETKLNPNDVPMPMAGIETVSSQVVLLVSSLFVKFTVLNMEHCLDSGIPQRRIVKSVDENVTRTECLASHCNV